MAGSRRLEENAIHRSESSLPSSGPSKASQESDVRRVVSEPPSSDASGKSQLYASFEDVVPVSGSGYPCPEPSCGKFFPLRHNLKAHLRLHTGEEPFQCGKCGRRWKWASSLKMHEIGDRCSAKKTSQAKPNARKSPKGQPKNGERREPVKTTLSKDESSGVDHASMSIQALMLPSDDRCPSIPGDAIIPDESRSDNQEVAQLLSRPGTFLEAMNLSPTELEVQPYSVSGKADLPNGENPFLQVSGNLTDSVDDAVNMVHAGLEDLDILHKDDRVGAIPENDTMGDFIMHGNDVEPNREVDLHQYDAISSVQSNLKADSFIQHCGDVQNDIEDEMPPSFIELPIEETVRRAATGPSPVTVVRPPSGFLRSVSPATQMFLDGIRFSYGVPSSSAYAPAFNGALRIGALTSPGAEFSRRRKPPTPPFFGSPSRVPSPPAYLCAFDSRPCSPRIPSPSVAQPTKRRTLNNSWDSTA